MIKLKRIYDPVDKKDGYRILVDRLWPRGVSKEEAKLDMWMKDIAPTGELRKWFSHDRKKWPEFEKRYLKELKNKKDQKRFILSKRGYVTLVYGAKDREFNNAVVIKKYLEH